MLSIQIPSPMNLTGTDPDERLTLVVYEQEETYLHCISAGLFKIPKVGRELLDHLKQYTKPTYNINLWKIERAFECITIQNAYKKRETLGPDGLEKINLIFSNIQKHFVGYEWQNDKLLILVNNSFPFSE